MARQILSLQRNKGFVGVARSRRDASTSEYFTDEESDDSHISLNESLVFMFDDMESDGKIILTYIHFIRVSSVDVGHFSLPFKPLYTLK